MNNTVNKIESSKKKKAAKILATVAMASAIIAIFLAVIFDVIAFKEVILQFVAALILPVIAFVFLFIAMLASFILIFGIFLIKEYGFWPLSLSFQFFKELLNEIKVTEQAIQTFTNFRIVLIAICVVIIALAVVSKILNVKPKKENSGNEKKFKIKDGINSKSTTAIVFGILGLIVSLSALAIVGQI